MARDPEKKKASDRARYQSRNPEKQNALDRARYHRNPEKKKASCAKYREQNRKKIAAVNKVYREQNREKVAASKRDSNKRNYKRISSYTKAYRKRNHERYRELHAEGSRRRRCKKKNSSIYLTANEKEKILLLERTRQEIQTETGRAYHIDHILPLSHGGIHHPVNLRILDAVENISKWNKLLPEAIALAPEHFRLYSERVSPERAWGFVRQLAAGLGLSEKDLDALITGKPLKNKPTLEDFML
jgi:hypothetical protein